MVTPSNFKFIAGTLCLDFVNTVGGRIGPGLQDQVLSDKVTCFADLVQWCQAASVLSQAEARAFGRRAAQGQAVFDRALALREALYRICRCSIAARAPRKSDVEILNRELTTQHLQFSRGGFVWTWDHPDALDRILWTIARSAALFLASRDRALLRQCPGHDCGWMFRDTSRNHSRQWCEMRICGNRAKLRRYRQRLN